MQAANRLAEKAVNVRSEAREAFMAWRGTWEIARHVQAAAKQIVKPDALTWVIVGDLSKIEAGVRALDLGAVQVVDADGKPVAKK